MRTGLISILLLAAFVFGVSNSASSRSALPGYRTKTEAGVANVLLYKYDPRGEDFSKARSLSDAFLPYVGYVNRSGKVTDKFFDGILLMDTSPFFGNPSVATMKEWEKFIEATFKARRNDAKPAFSHPGHVSEQCVEIPYKHGCVYQDLVYPKDSLLTIVLHVKVDTISDDPHDGYIGVMAFDHAFRELKVGVSGLIYSTYLGLWYEYIDAETTWQERQVQFNLPDSVYYFSIFLGSWHTPRIFYDNISLNGAMIVDGDFEGGSSAWKSRDFPNAPLQQENSAVLVALDQTVSMVAEQLEDSGMKEQVILMIPWDHRSHLQTNFGQIDGRTRDLSKTSDATRAVKWFVKRCVEEWKSLQPKWLELSGFYWLNEAGNDSRKVDFEEISGYIHNLGYRLYASPYHSFWHEPSKGKEYVPYFDCLWLQPNAWPPDIQGKKSQHYYSSVERAYRKGWLSADSIWVRNNGIPMEELKETETIAESLNMGINMEWTRGQESVQGYGRILDYIDEEDLLPHNFSEASHLFFDAGGFGWFCCYSNDEVFREQYDAVYEFVKRTSLKR